MSSIQNSRLLVTPLNQNHKKLKARMVDFGGWEMPVQYSSLIEEHKTVRSQVGLFDVSHMGEIIISGPDAVAFLQNLTINDVGSLFVGQAQYNAMCHPDGGVIDDIIVYRTGQNSYFLCVNASNTQKDFEWMLANKGSWRVVVENQSDDYAQIAVQGPKARELVSKIVDIQVQNLKYYTFAEGKVLSHPSIIARTGYTGELGFELYIPSQSASKIWDSLLEIGAALGVKPIGLGARDTLRLEMGFLLYGNDMDQTVTPLQCGLNWITKLNKGSFIGSQVLEKQKKEGLKKQLVGLQMSGKAIARHGYPVFLTEQQSQPDGVITSGTQSPMLQTNIAMAYVPLAASKIGSTVFVQIREEKHPAVVVKRPFYNHGTAQT